MKITRIPVVLVFLSVIIGLAANNINAASTGNKGGQSCQSVNETEIAALFDRWNDALQSGDADKVVSLYAKRSVLLPTISNKPRLTPSEKAAYFRHFLEKSPSAKIDFRQIEIGCNMVSDTGLYTFAMAKNGEIMKGRYSFTYRWNGSRWLIVSHHSSLMPETK